MPLDLKVLRVSGMKIRDVVKLIETDGWYLVRARGSHRQYKHPFRKGLVTIAGRLNDDIAKGTLNSVLRQAGLKEGGEGA